MIIPALFSFLKIVLTIWSFLWLHMSFRMILSSSMKNVLDILIGIALNLQIALGSYGHFNNILPIQEYGSFHFFISYSVSFISASFQSIGVLFDAVLNRNAFQFSLSDGSLLVYRKQIPVYWVPFNFAEFIYSNIVFSRHFRVFYIEIV